LIDPSEVEDGTVVRMPKAYPVYDHQYHESIAMVRQYLERFTNLQTIGRNGLHRYNNQDHSMLTGVYAARNTVGDKYDVWAVNTEKEYHEAGQVADAARGDRRIPTRVAPAVPESVHALDEMINAAFAPLDPLALGLAVGLVSGTGLFVATVVLLLHGGPVVGPTLSLLGHYLLGFEVTWPGAFLGLVEAGAGGFALGCFGAWLRNGIVDAYASLIKRQV
jgi:hypothetical protein